MWIAEIRMLDPRIKSTYAVPKIPADDHERKHPWDELVAMRGSDESAPSGEIAAAGGGPTVAGTASAGGGVGGAIRGRSDVALLLDKICRYYAENEPSSPVPLLLERAKRLATMNFLEILNDLTPDGVQQFGVIAGIKQEEQNY